MACGAWTMRSDDQCEHRDRWGRDRAEFGWIDTMRPCVVITTIIRNDPLERNLMPILSKRCHNRRKM